MHSIPHDTPAAPPVPDDEFRRGWTLLLSATFGVGLGLSPLPFYTSGVFIAPLHQAFGWDTAQVLSALIGTTIGAMIAAPIAGALSDRHGVRRVALISTTIYGLSWLLLTLINGSVLLFDAIWVVIGVAGAGTLPLTWTRPINNSFVIHRGMALGIALFATGLFGAFVKLYARFLIVHIGWRGAYACIGLLPLLISLPIAILFFHDSQPRKVDAAHSLPTGKSLQMALLDRRFWTMGLTLTCTAFALGGPLPNLEQILGTKGFSPGNAVLIASFLGYSVMVGRILGGWCLDHVWAPLVGFVLLACPAVALVTLSHPGHLHFLIASGSIGLLGVAVGSEYDLMAFLTARYFGMRSYSTIYGVLYAFYTLGAGFAPSLFGRSFDIHGNYNHALFLAAGLTLVGASLLLTLGRYPTHE